MNSSQRDKKSSYKFIATIAAILAILSIVLIVIPAENVMGSAVKYVYLHVALAFTGTIGFGLMGVTGIFVLIFSRESLLNLVMSLGWISVIAHTLSIMVSMIPASIIWGSVSFTEPYMVMSIQILLAALVVQISYILIPWLKLKALMSLIPILFQLWLANTTKLILHPSSPIRDSSSDIIKISFVAVFVPCVLLSGIMVYYLFNYLKTRSSTHKNKMQISVHILNVVLVQFSFQIIYLQST
jgi:hypothetical protein